jgi:DNA-binding transcriptional ArsR family regulator
MDGESKRIRRLIVDELGECCDTAVEQRLDELEALSTEIPETYTTDIAAFNTLGNDTRYRLIRLLNATDDELCVCELTPLLEVSESAISHALSDLAEAGLVTRRKEGTWRYYDTTDRADGLIEALDGSRGDAA